MLVIQKGFEKLEIYDLKGKFLQKEDRKKFFKEIKKEFADKGSISRKVKRVLLILMNSNGNIFIQKRSRRKKENPGLYDKTVGGHVAADHTWYLTVVKECHEELGLPGIILTGDEFKNAIFSTDLKVIGLLREVDHIPNDKSVRKGKIEIVQPYMTKVYIGYYDGPIRFKDGESIGIEVFTEKELEKELKEYPEKFTEDLKTMVHKYKKYLVPLNKLKL